MYINNLTHILKQLKNRSVKIVENQYMRSYVHPNNDLKVPLREPDHVDDDDIHGTHFYWFHEMICLRPRKTEHVACKMMFCEYLNSLMFSPETWPWTWASINDEGTLEAWQRYIVEKELLGAFPEQESSKT
jgi:hypothetical protein